MFNRKCIFKWWIFYCHVSFRGSTPKWQHIWYWELPLSNTHTDFWIFVTCPKRIFIQSMTLGFFALHFEERYPDPWSMGFWIRKILVSANLQGAFHGWFEPFERGSNVWFIVQVTTTPIFMPFVWIPAVAAVAQVADEATIQHFCDHHLRRWRRAPITCVTSKAEYYTPDTNPFQKLCVAFQGEWVGIQMFEHLGGAWLASADSSPYWMTNMLATGSRVEHDFADKLNLIGFQPLSLQVNSNLNHFLTQWINTRWD